MKGWIWWWIERGVLLSALILGCFPASAAFENELSSIAPTATAAATNLEEKSLRVLGRDQDERDSQIRRLEARVRSLESVELKVADLEAIVAVLQQQSNGQSIVKPPPHSPSLSPPRPSLHRSLSSSLLFSCS
jgi:hypothetical protein